MPKHNSDRITRRMLPWVFLLAMTGTLYIVYAPFHQAAPTEESQTWQEDTWFEGSDVAHNTPSGGQSLSTDYQGLENAREAQWEAEILAREKERQVAEGQPQTEPALKEAADAENTAQAVENGLENQGQAEEKAAKPVIVEKTETALPEETKTAEAVAVEPPSTPTTTNHVPSEKPHPQPSSPPIAPTATAPLEVLQAVEKTVESPNVSVSRGVFEKRLLLIGASNNAWQSIVQRKNVNPVLLRQLEGLVKRLAQPHKYVEILYSDYVRDGKADPANSKLLAVRTANWAFFTNEESGVLYFYDIDGNAPEPSMDRAPFRYSHISSEFSMNRLHPITRRMRPHLGVDLKGPYGTSIASTGVGMVSFAGWQSGYGRLVIVQHPNGYETRYAHLSSIDVEVGQQVKRGQTIGKLGNSGASTGAHLHFEVRINGVPYDPMTVKLPSYKPLRRSDLPAFRQYATLYLQTIDELKVKK